MLEFNLQDHKKSLLNSELTEHALVKLVQKISEGFTSQRDRIEEYLSEENLVSAYSYFYLPTNYPKFEFLFNRLPEDIKEDLKQSIFVDWGTGPGTYLLAFLERFPDAKVIGVDKSQLMLEQAQKMLKHYFSASDFTLTSRATEVSRCDNLYLNFGNSLNEMENKDVFDIIRNLEPKYVSFIEPGTPATFERIIQMRSHLINKGYSCVYPCSVSTGECPIALKKEQGIEDWCHQVLRTQHDSSVERFSQLVKLDRKTMPLTAHFYVKEENVTRETPIMVRYLRETKYSFEYQICLNEDGHSVLKTIEILKKSLSKKESKEFKKLSVGLDIDFEIIKKLSSDRYRVSIKKASD